MSQNKWWHRYSPTPSLNRNVAFLKRLIWAYVLLWIFEGVLRKWIFPAYSAEFLLIRDPIAVWIIYFAAARSIWKPNLWIVTLVLIGVLSLLVTCVLGIYLPVGLIGFRTLCLHFPLIFIIGQVLTRADVEQLGNIFLDGAFPMGLLMAAQFVSPSSSLLNAGAGIDSVQIEGGDGRIRAPGVFSFISGAAQYYGLTAALLFPRVVSRTKQSLWLLVAPAVGLALAMTMAISRTLTISVGLVVAVFVLSCVRTGIPFRKLLPIFLIFLVIGAMLAFSSTVREGIDAFTQRWNAAESGEGSTLSRAIDGYLVDSSSFRSAGLAGNGLGVGTNMGAKLMTGEVGFLLAEQEWDRLILEMGIPLGMAFIFWRIALAGMIGVKSIKALARKDILPVVILTAAAPSLLNGQTGVASTLGFCVLASGLALAASKSNQVFTVHDGLLIQRGPSSKTNPRHRRQLVH